MLIRLLTFLFILRSSLSLNCYQCSGSDPEKPFQCNEWLTSDIDIQPQSCDNVYDAKFCVKHTGRHEACSLLCYRCTARETIDCSDGMIHMDGITPQNCDDVFEAQYCVKAVTMDGGVGATRFCSSLDLGNYCNYVNQPGDSLTYRTCIFTCSGDGCNPSNRLKANSFITAGLILVFYLVVK